MDINFGKTVEKRTIKNASLQEEGAHNFVNIFGNHSTLQKLTEKVWYTGSLGIVKGKPKTEAEAMKAILESRLAEDADSAKSVLLNISKGRWYDLPYPHAFRIVTVGDSNSQSYRLEKGLGVRKSFY